MELPAENAWLSIIKISSNVYPVRSLYSQAEEKMPLCTDMKDYKERNPSTYSWIL